MSLRAKTIRPLFAGVVAAAGIFSLSISMGVPAVHAKYQPNEKIADASANSGNPIVELETTKGPIKIRVFKKQAPITSDNFLDLVSRHFYDGLTFHRYEPGFVIQGGDPQGTGVGNFVDPKTGKERFIKLEKDPALKHDSAGTVAMARTADPNSASCQFYITLKATPFLDEPPGYAVFGKVIDGMENVKKLRAGDKMTKVFMAK